MFKNNQSEKIKLGVNSSIGWFKRGILNWFHQLLPWSGVEIFLSCYYLLFLVIKDPSVSKTWWVSLSLNKGFSLRSWKNGVRREVTQISVTFVNIKRHHDAYCELMVLTGISENMSGWWRVLIAPASGLAWYLLYEWYWFLGLTHPSSFPAHLCKCIIHFEEWLLNLLVKCLCHLCFLKSDSYSYSRKEAQGFCRRHLMGRIML